MRGRRLLLAMAAAGLMMMPMLPAHATDGALCQLAGTVHLGTQTDLTNADKGTGSFSAGALLSCTGTVDGTGVVSGAFSFCKRAYSGPATTNPACSNQTADPTLDPILDSVNTSTGQGLTAYFRGGPVTATGFTVGGTSCSFSFEGDAITAQAVISIQNFKCSGLPGVIMSGSATASSVPLVGPCGNSLCFQDVVFLGTIAVSAL